MDSGGHSGITEPVKTEPEGVVKTQGSDQAPMDIADRHHIGHEIGGSRLPRPVSIRTRPYIDDEIIGGSLPSTTAHNFHHAHLTSRFSQEYDGNGSSPYSASPSHSIPTHGSYGGSPVLRGRESYGPLGTSPLGSSGTYNVCIITIESCMIVHFLVLFCRHVIETKISVVVPDSCQSLRKVYT